jgi:hypothetical protein
MSHHRYDWRKLPLTRKPIIEKIFLKNALPSWSTAWPTLHLSKTAKLSNFVNSVISGYPLVLEARFR